MATPRACASCGQHAPIVLRGVEAFCTVCGARRTPFAADILNVAGKPALIGGHAARVAGWSFLAIGLFVALTVGLVVQAVASMLDASTWLGLAIGIPIALFSVGVALFGILGGKKLVRTGEQSLRKAQVETIQGLARHHGGVVKVNEAARALNLDEARADAILVTLAKDPNQNVSIDVDDAGNLSYLFGSAPAIRWRIRAEQTNLTSADREALKRELERIEERRIEEERFAAEEARGQAQRR